MGDFASSIQAVALRVCKLGADGAPLVGANSAYVTKAFTSLSFTPEYEEGDEITTKAADGSTCIYYKMPDTLKQVTLELSICNPEPEVYEILAGGTILMDTETVPSAIGWLAPPTGTDPTPNGVSIEVWSRAIVGGKPAATLPYWRWVIPYARTKMSGDRVLENGAMANTFSGYGFGNPDWADGPGGDWTYPSTSPFAYVRTATFPGTTGYVAVT